MTVEFKKGSGREDHWLIARGDGSSEQLLCPKQGILPHQMAHYAVESVLNRSGFLAKVAQREVPGFAMSHSDRGFRRLPPHRLWWGRAAAGQAHRDAVAVGRAVGPRSQRAVTPMSRALAAAVWGVLLCLAAGCQSVPPPPAIRVPATHAVLSFEFADLRAQKPARTLEERDSLGTTTDLGEDAYVRPSATLVTAWLQDRVGAALAGKRVELTAFSAQVFEPAAGNTGLGPARAPMPAAQGAGASVVLGNALGVAIIEAIARRSTSTLVSARIEARVNGELVVGVSRQSLKGRISKEDIYQVIHEALDDLCVEAARL